LYIVFAISRVECCWWWWRW